MAVEIEESFMNNERALGTIKCLVKEKGYGFLTGPHGDVFFHRSTVATLFNALMIGDRVTYIETNGPRGLRGTELERAL